MCGIAGYVAFDGSMPPRETIERMLAALRHRGPDGFGIYYGERCVLGHARLSIIDLEGGWQPIFNEKRDVAVTFNGEIYNYIELRKELEADGHRFYTNSDTEVIVHAYEKWGTACPERFNGQFAFAIHDDRDRTLFLCRDRLGVRPVYHARAGNIFFFASEVKALNASGLVPLEPSMEGLHQIFTLWTNVSPRTPFSDVFELPPAHGMVVSPRGTGTKRYWSLPIGRKEALSPGECVEGLKAHIERSVRLRLRADVPVGAYLSGGLDSSLTAAFTRRCTSTPLKTFSLEFEDPRFDESEYQGEMARLLGTEHSSIRVGTEEIAVHFPRRSGRRSGPFYGPLPSQCSFCPGSFDPRGTRSSLPEKAPTNSSSDTTFSRKRRSGSIAAVGPSPGFGLSSSGACTRTCSRTVGRRGSRRRSS